MKISFKKIVALCLIISVFAVMLSACFKNPANKANFNDGADSEYNLMDVSDSSQLPDWKGEQLTIRYWQGHGTGGARSVKESKGDVVTPEIKRVTGITVDESNSFDNGTGQTFNVKLGLLAAANEWPSIVLNAGDLKALVDANKIYDLTELIPKYCPNIVKKIPLEWKTIWEDDQRVSANIKGKIYGVPSGLNEASLKLIDPSLDVNKYSLFSPIEDSRGYVWVRDDILKKIYPHAKTQKEIEALFAKNQRFTKEDILDVSFNTKEEFVKFLYDVKNLKITENGQEVFPIYLYSGLDNWSLLSELTGWLDGRTRENNYFSYFDRPSSSVQFVFDKPDFKDSLKVWNKLVRDEIASKESFVDTNAMFKEKLMKGLYAVSYTVKPDNLALEKQGKPYAYRKVYIDIKANTEKYYEYATLPYSTSNIAILKDKVKEKDLPQVLRWIDFMQSDVGEKLTAWGPKSAGLWEEKNGIRVFKDKELEDCMVYFQNNQKDRYYNLLSGNPSYDAVGKPTGMLSITYMRNACSKFAPAMVSNRQFGVSDTNTFFSMGFVDPSKRVDSRKPDFWTFIMIPEVEKAWKARKAFEDALTKVMVASNDSHFETLYNEFISIARKSGYTDEVVRKISEKFTERNKDKMENLK